MSIDDNRLVLRHDATDTQVAAARSAYGKSGTQRRAVYDAIEEAEGLTDHEIADRLSIYLSSVNASRNSLVKDGFVQDSGARRPSGRGGMAIVWEAT